MYKDLKAIRGKFFIHRLIEEGEHEHQDFKYKISDARKIARSISAFANNDGGQLLVGVKDNGVIAGIRSEEDLHVIEAAAEVFCRPRIEIEMQAYQCEGGLVVLRALIPRSRRRPVEVREEDGQWRSYYRVADENIVAHPLMVRAWRLENSSADVPALSYDRGDGDLLAALRHRGEASVEELMVDVHLSRQTAEATIVRLVGLGLIGFRYRHPRFVLTLLE